MASLTESSIIVRKSIRYGIYILVIIVVARLLIGGGIALYNKLFPPPPPKPTLVFGNLPALPFPKVEVPTGIEYNLELAEGKLPTLATQALVYSMPLSQSNINVLDDAKARAQRLEFDPNGRLLLETIPNVYIFQKKNIPSTLTMNIISGVFSISYNVEANLSILSGTPLAPGAATSYVSAYLSGAGLLLPDLKIGPNTTQLLKVDKGKFVPADSLSEANVIRVNMFRKNYGKENVLLPSVSPKMPGANVWFILAGGKQVIAAEYHYYPIDESKSGTYPLKTVNEAWEELNNGNGYVVNLGNNTDKVTIRKVYMAYYDAGQYTPYYQPVIVFEGDNNFFAYVPAVQKDYYGTSEVSPTGK
jgi:hypothetical protein